MTWLGTRRSWIVGAWLALGILAGCKQCRKDDAEAVVCPAPVHPDYCRHDCKRFTQRRSTRHASRVDDTEEGKLGTCGKYDVFTQHDVKTDASIVEYFDRESGELVGAVDPRRDGCATFGTVPECTIALRDLPWPWAEYRVVEASRDAGATVDVVLHEYASDRSVDVWNCYTEALWADAGARGTILLAVARDPAVDTGDAITVSVVEPTTLDGGGYDGGAAFGDRATAECVARAFRTHTFSLPDGVRAVIEVTLHPLERDH